MKAFRNHNRRGAILLVVLVCLIVITLMCVALLRQGIMGRGQVQSEERRVQARWLAESGLERAASRLASDAGYQGESWKIKSDAIGGRWPGLVTITVASVKGHPARRLVQVQADYPSDATLRARERAQAMIELSSEPSGETQ
jgi:Tfp pilus assembly protein PilX